jgi:hypothetical protein
MDGGQSKIYMLLHKFDKSCFFGVSRSREDACSICNEVTREETTALIATVISVAGWLMAANCSDSWSKCWDVLTAKGTNWFRHGQGGNWRWNYQQFICEQGIIVQNYSLPESGITPRISFCAKIKPPRKMYFSWWC